MIDEEASKKNAERAKKWRAAHPNYQKEYMKKYREENGDKMREADRKYHAEHREEKNAARRQWALENPEKQAATQRRWEVENKEYIRNYQLQRKYGITLEQFDEMLAKQGGKCAIVGCANPNGKGRAGYVPDHDHKTGKVRGVICPAHNKALGFVKDNASELAGLAQYLEQSKT